MTTPKTDMEGREAVGEIVAKEAIGDADETTPLIPPAADGDAVENGLARTSTPQQSTSQASVSRAHRTRSTCQFADSLNTCSFHSLCIA